MEQEDFRQEFEREVEKAKQNSMLSPEYRRRKFVMYLIRTTIAGLLFYIFWEHKWVRWALIAYIPLNLMALFSIFGAPYFLNRKIEKTREYIDELEALEEDYDDWEEE